MRLGLATRIFVGLFVVLLTFGALAVFCLAELHRNQQEIRLLSAGYVTLSQVAAGIETLQASHRRDTERLRDEASAETRRAVIKLARGYFPESLSARLDEAVDVARRTVGFAPEDERPHLEETARRLLELKQSYAGYGAAAESAFELLEAGAPPWPEALARLDRLERIQQQLSASMRRIHGSIEARLLDRARRAEERERRTGLIVLVLSVVATAVGSVAVALTARGLRPVRELIAGVDRVRRGDYTATLDVTGSDEIARLAREFDAMARALREREALLHEKQAELLRSERLAAAGRVSAQVAHEVRNPLSSIGLNVEMLLDLVGRARFPDDATGAEARELVTSVTREIDRLTEITEGYLRLARLPSPSLRRENLRAVVEGILDFSREELERSGIRVDRALGAADVAVEADEAQLRQLLLNLIRNAREAMRSGGTLTVSAEQVPDTPGVVRVRVQDTGPGLPAGATERLFEPFFSTKEGGSGLGLSLSRQIAAAHRGRLEAVAGNASGAAFVLSLPIAPPHEGVLPP